MVRSHEKYKQVTRGMWLNITVFNQSELYMAVRQLEFSLLLIQQIYELFAAVQSLLQGRLRMSVVNPTTLHGILWNVSLNLPENYELIVVTNLEDIHLYYELIKVAIVGNVHGIKLVMSIPLKTADQHFTLYKIVPLPSRIAEEKFVKHSLEYSYFALANSQHDYLLLTEADLSQCSMGSINICSNNVALYDVQVVTCVSSLYFQDPNSYSLCRRSLLLQYKIPTLQRHKNVWIYQFPEPRQVNIRCRKDREWTTHTVLLSDAGFIYNASSCAIATYGIRTLPELHRATKAKVDIPLLHLPVVKHELPQILEAAPPEIGHLATAHHSYDVDTLFHVHRTSLRAERKSYWHLIITTAVSTLTALLVLYFSLRHRIPYFQLHCFSTNTLWDLDVV